MLIRSLVWYADLFHRLKSFGISGQIFGLILSFLSNRWLWVVLNWKSSQKYPVNAGVPQCLILGLTLFLLYINHLPYYVISNITVYADDKLLSTLIVIKHPICGNKQNWLLNLNLIYKILRTEAEYGLLILMQE